MNSDWQKPWVLIGIPWQYAVDSLLWNSIFNIGIVSRQWLAVNRYTVYAIEHMGNTTPSLSRTVNITNQLGLHARAAAKIAKIAESASAGVWIIRNRQRADASSILDILTLANEEDAHITIAVDNPSDMDILNAIEEMVKKGFGE